MARARIFSPHVEGILYSTHLFFCQSGFDGPKVTLEQFRVLHTRFDKLALWLEADLIFVYLIITISYHCSIQRTSEN
jgi:hypothetical protein